VPLLYWIGGGLLLLLLLLLLLAEELDAGALLVVHSEDVPHLLLTHGDRAFTLHLNELGVANEAQLLGGALVN